MQQFSTIAELGVELYMIFRRHEKGFTAEN